MLLSVAIDMHNAYLGYAINLWNIFYRFYTSPRTGEEYYKSSNSGHTIPPSTTCTVNSWYVTDINYVFFSIGILLVEFYKHDVGQIRSVK